MVRYKMSREERAKQFMPFAALKGYHEALRKKEQEVKEYELHRIPGNDIISVYIEKGEK